MSDMMFFQFIDEQFTYRLLYYYYYNYGKDFKEFAALLKRIETFGWESDLIDTQLCSVQLFCTESYYISIIVLFTLSSHEIFLVTFISIA